MGSALQYQVSVPLMGHSQACDTMPTGVSVPQPEAFQMPLEARGVEAVLEAAVSCSIPQALNLG